MNEDIFQRICRRIEAKQSDMIRLQIALTAIPALSPENGGTGEEAKATFLAGHLDRCGFRDVIMVPAPDDRVPCGYRPNLIVRVPGRRPRTLWILTHLDVVPPGDRQLWHSDPYRAEVRDGRIFGRGTEDNQQDLVASLTAAQVIQEEDVVPEYGIGLVFVSDEETSSRCGLSHLLERETGWFSPQDLFVVPDGGDMQGAAIQIAEKGILWLCFRTTGKQCHASMPAAGNNAFLAASHLVVSLQDLHRRFAAEDPLFEPPGSTFQPTKKDANLPNINTIPGEDVFYMDCRILPRYPLGEIEGEARRIADAVSRRFGVSVEIDRIQEVHAPAPVPEDAPVVRVLRRAIARVYDVNARICGSGSGTVAAYFRQRGYPAAVWTRANQTLHQPNEHCLIANMVDNAKVFAHLFLDGTDDPP